MPAGTRTKKPRAAKTKPRRSPARPATRHGSGGSWLSDLKERAEAAAEALKGKPQDVSRKLDALERLLPGLKRLNGLADKDPGAYRAEQEAMQNVVDGYAADIRKSKDKVAIGRLEKLLAPPVDAPRIRVHAVLELPKDVRDGDTVVFTVKSHTKKGGGKA